MPNDSTEKIGMEAFLDMTQFNAATKAYNAAVLGMEQNTVQSAKRIEDATKYSDRGFQNTGKSALTASERLAVFTAGIGSAIVVLDRIAGRLTQAAEGVVKLTREAAEVQTVRAAFIGLGGDIEKMRRTSGGLVDDV